MLTAFAGIFMAWSIGANDVANALGTPVGSGMISARKALKIFNLSQALKAHFY